MQRIILDTNVIISGLIQKGIPNLVLTYCIIEDSVILCLSPDLLGEYIEVLHRPKFSKFPDFLNNAEFILSHFGHKAKMFYPKTKVNIIADYNDNRILELAIESNADFIITGNSIDFTMDFFYYTKVITPKRYWKLFGIITN